LLNRIDDGRSVVRAVLGPTNTGKTHRAIERMLEHDSGMIGLPLRLLAREVYDRITRRIGEAQVALVTGEEKRVPSQPRYWVCTVEAMPIDREVDFVAVDEVQLAAHPERGHVFSDRLLRARGTRETWFLGSDTMRPLLQRLLPIAHHERHPRLSRLSGVGTVPLAALPPRSAVVAFSTARVYELAERLRARRGGAAIVLGALSPRARNAQVALYQSGEVDYMVATDAIGMGLNLDVDLVAFADLRKFDGQEVRSLQPAELAQIAGRAGRHHNDGAFATLGPLPPLAPPIARAIETHTFSAETRLWWRNADLDYRSLPDLVRSLKQKPQRPELRLAERASDLSALEALQLDHAVAEQAKGSEAVSLLWDVCQIPDFRKLMLDEHTRLVGDVFLQLAGKTGRLSDDWLAERIARIDDPSGDIDTLLSRMAFIRTWTYVTNHSHWVEHAGEWQERTRAIEDRLSDALHEQLVQRFLDRSRPGKQRSRARARKPSLAASEGAPIDPSGPFAQLAKLRLGRGPAVEVSREAWVEDLIEAPHERFALDPQGVIRDGERVIAHLKAGVDLLHPDVRLSELDLGPGARTRILRRLVAWARDMVSELLAPLHPRELASLSAPARGIVYQLERGLGTLDARAAEDQLRALSAEDRARFVALGVQLGARFVYLRALLRPAALERRAALCCVFAASARDFALPRPGAVSLRAAPALAPLYLAMGYPVLGRRAVRVDIAEKAHARFAHTRTPTAEERRTLASWLGCPVGELGAIMKDLGEWDRSAPRPLCSAS
jgi:ATP-dependent RNA helicase SUPV3L1/SUV3